MAPPFGAASCGNAVGRFGSSARAPERRRRPSSRRASVQAVECAGVRAGYVGILSVELHFPDAGSLKGKRKYVKSAKAQLQNRFGASVAEVDHHELWQRSRLTVACVAREAREAERLLDEAERYLIGQEWDVGSIERRIVVPADD